MTNTDQNTPPPGKGLSSAEASAALQQWGRNELEAEKRNHLLDSLRNIVTEPMFLLLLVACLLYFFLGDTTEAIMMMVSILFVAGIEIYQENKSERALEALRRYTRAQVQVFRDGQWHQIPSEELVPGDMVAIEEGERIPADGQLQEQHDLTVDESVLTGESLAVEKGMSETARILYQGTTVASGKGIFMVTATGVRTEFGKLGQSIEQIDTTPTPLQIQIKTFVRQMGIVGIIAFVLVFALNLVAEHDVWRALLFSLTLAMAILPEEIPVAFSAFMGLGAYRMIQHHILAKQPKTVESLGSATVICLDKTGTITENQMTVAQITDFSPNAQTLRYALWSSEPDPFDAMEKAIVKAAITDQNDPRNGFQIIREYALSGNPPMMTHIWEDTKGNRIVAAKGAVERILQATGADETQQRAAMAQTEAMAANGYRVLGVASAVWDEARFPDEQTDFNWQLEGLIAFYDPPKKNAKAVFNKLYKAGLRVIMITGDHAATAQNIAHQVGIRNTGAALTGAQVMALSDAELCEAVQHTHLFARMFPDAKLKVVNALKANGETVAMSGDGVNDGPALKSAQIGVAMGKKGTEIAKSAASLVLLNDDLNALPTAIAMGRRIYDNLRKAIRYIISIHLPIVLLVLIPLLLGWPYPHILLPLHVIFLELIMDPTAAIAFENEPAEPDLMARKPRHRSAPLFTQKELLFSIFQGLMLTAGVLLMYQFALYTGKDEAGVRTMVFTTLVSGNLFLTLSNRSFRYAYDRTLFYKNAMLPYILAISAVMLLLLLYVPFLTKLFQMTPPSVADLGWCVLTGFVSVAWFEVYKKWANNR